MIKRLLCAVALLCALAGSLKAQNTTTFGNIVAMGVPCGAANCVYYQLPPATQWVSVTVTGTWTGTLETAVTSAPNANYSNLNTVTWTAVATETTNGTWTVATSGSTYLRVRATSWTGGAGSLARVAMDSTLTQAPLMNPIFLGALTATGVAAANGGSGSNCWYTNGSNGPCLSNLNLAQGIVKGTGSGTTNSAAAYGDVVALFAGGSCNGFLYFNGTCPASASTPAANGISQTAANYSNLAINYSAAPRVGYQMPALNGFYYPALTTTNITSQGGTSTNLSNYTVSYENTGGTVVGTCTGVGATTAGTAGTAYIPFLQPLDPTLPTRIVVHTCIGSNTTTPDTNLLKVAISNSGGSGSYGFIASNVSQTYMNTTQFGGTVLNEYGNTGGIPSYTTGSFFLDYIGTGAGGLDASGNEYAWGGWIPDTVSILQEEGIPAFGVAYTSRPVVHETAITPASLANITGIYISDASVNTIVTGVYVSQGRLDGPTDGLMPTPGYVSFIVGDDGAYSRTYPANVWIPYYYGPPTGNPIAEIFHANANTNQLNGPGSPLYPNFFSDGGPNNNYAGMIVASITGDSGAGYNTTINGCSAGTNIYCSPTSTDWFSLTGNKYRNNLVGLIRQYLPNANQLFRMGMSMGAGDVVQDEILHPGGAAIAVFSPAWNLTGAWNLSGAAPYGSYSNFQANIQNAYGTWCQSLVGGNQNNSPLSSPVDWNCLGAGANGLSLGWESTHFKNRGAYNSGTSYNQNDLVEVPYSGTIASLAPFDPYLNYTGLSTIPIQSWTETGDSVVPTAWSAGMIAQLNALGNVNAVNVQLNDCTPGTGVDCHLNAGVFTNGTATTPPYNTTNNVSPALTFFRTWETPFSPTVGSPQTQAQPNGTTQPHNYATVTATSGATATAVAPCTASRCQVTFSGGTVTTGAIFTLAWPSGTFATIPLCSANEQANTSLHGLSSPLSGTTLTGTTVDAAVTVASASFTVVVNCSQP
ncbi:hypothetical protein ACFPT7_02220 [Acidicapsa dinghuensis]|uniref:Tannase/feruloyl esterase family alpha/beta hydrolase n=1 Tax=Acidicapsa dinghuensis TaxID=2218256 RepID=A0ABW1E9T9_9BACT|nr:hypothetical protein [Acidicapsa dinghuensis]